MSRKKDGLFKAAVIVMWSVIALAVVLIGAWVVYLGLNPHGSAPPSGGFPTGGRPPSTPTRLAQPTASLTPFVPDDTTAVPPPPPTNTAPAVPTATQAPPSPTLTPAISGHPALLFVGADGCSVQEFTPQSGMLLPLTQHSPASGCNHPELSPDGTRLAFLMPGSYASLYVMSVDGSGLQRIAQGYVYDYAWSADGRRLVFARYIPAQGAVGLYFVNADGSGETHSAYAGISITATSIHIAWSPDGSWIYAPVKDPTGADQSLPFALNANGVDFVQLGAKGIAPAARASWSPDSRSVSYLLQGYDYGYAVTLLNFLGIDGLPIPSIYYDDPTVQSATLNPEGRFTTIPFWSRDGGRAVLAGKSSLVEGEYQVLVLDRGTGAFHLLANLPQPADEAAWAPSGDRIAFLLLPVPDSGGLVQLMIVNSDGTGLQTVAQAVSDSPPVWVMR